MDQSIAIEVKNVTKKFKIYKDKGHMLKEKALHWSRNHYEERSVLNGISFSIKKGEAVGLIGHNGCGKSTTLKMLTRIMYPDSGSIEINGRVSSLLELGAGFHPDLSGRENIYINASIFGLSRKEIDQRIDDIIRFSELEEFIDNPVRTYSSGMYMRLAFSVAINVDAEILLIDEILGVGDANFQLKCFERLMDIKSQGTTIVIVSHSLSQVEQVCERSIWIHDGNIRMDGTPQEVNKAYLSYMEQLRIRRMELELAQSGGSAHAKKGTEQSTEIIPAEPAGAEQKTIAGSLYYDTGTDFNEKNKYKLLARQITDRMYRTTEKIQINHTKLQQIRYDMLEGQSCFVQNLLLTVEDNFGHITKELVCLENKYFKGPDPYILIPQELKDGDIVCINCVFIVEVD